MSETKFTPGPWRASKDGFDVENVVGAGVCALYADETCEANARLIAAAPEMYEAVATLVRMVTDGDWTTVELNEARALLARVEGG